jgi:hypothetical protein
MACIGLIICWPISWAASILNLLMNGAGRPAAAGLPEISMHGRRPGAVLGPTYPGLVETLFKKAGPLQSGGFFWKVLRR